MRYPALRVIVFLHYALAVVVACVASLLMMGPADATLKMGFMLGALSAILLLVAFAEALGVVMDIEANTRTIADAVALPTSSAAPPLDTTPQPVR